MGNRPAITDKMRLHVLKQFGAVVLCQICGQAERIALVQIDHELALINSGTHETDNMRPVCIPCHANKSAREHKDNSKVKRIVRKAAIPSGNGSIRSRGFDKSLTKKFNGKVVPRG